MISIQNFDLVRNLSLYKASIASYKYKSQSANELGLVADSVFKRLDNQKQAGGQRKNTSKMVDHMYKQFQNLGVNVPIPGLEDAKIGRVYTELESQIKKDLLKEQAVYMDILNNPNKSDGDKEIAKKRLDRIQADLDALGKDFRLVDGLLKMFTMMTQFLGLGFNYPGFSPNYIAGQLNNRYEAADGRIFNIQNYKDSMSAYMKHSDAAKFFGGVVGMFAGAALLPGIAGIGGGFALGHLLTKLSQKAFGNNKGDFEAVQKTSMFMKINDIMQVVQNESYKPFSFSSIVSSNKNINAFLSSKAVGAFREYADPYKATNEAETLNQGILAQSMMRNIKVKDVNGNEISFLDALGTDGNLDPTKIGNKIKYNDKTFTREEYQKAISNEIRSEIRRTQGDYREGMTVMFKRHAWGRSLVQFRTWLAESVAIDWEDSSKDYGLTDQIQGTALEVKGRFKTAFQSMGMVGGLSIAAAMRLTPLAFVSSMTGSAIPLLVYGGMLGVMAWYIKRKGLGNSTVDGIMPELGGAIFKNLPLMRKIFKDSKPEQEYFQDLISDKFNATDAANMRAMAAKLRYSMIMFGVYALGMILKSLSDDDDDEISKIGRRSAFIALNLAGRSYSDNTMTIDPKASLDRWSKLDGIMPAYRSMREFGQVANPANWTKVYKRGDKRRGIKKGDSRLWKEIMDIVPVWNKFDQLDYMASAGYV
jgi:hypothetical protein